MIIKNKPFKLKIN